MRDTSLICPTCGASLKRGDVNLLQYGRSANVCPHCGGRFSATLRSLLVWFGVFSLLSLFGIATIFHLFPDLIVQDSNPALLGHHWQNKLIALPVLLMSAWAASRALGRRVKLRAFPPLYVPTEQDRALMTRFSITYNGQYFSVRGMNFDKLQEAAAFAHEAAKRMV